MDDKKSVLHELYVFSEWKPEPEYLQKPDNLLPDSISALWRWVKFFGPKKSLIDSITAHKNKHQKWHIAVGDEGKVIAILTDNILEIRTKRSEYATIAARTTVARDPYPQWRKVVWSPDCSFIAIAYGNGIVSFFDLTASNLFTIPTDCSRPGGLECTDNTHAVAEIIFTPLRVKDNKWSWEVLIATYDGHLRNFLVSQTAGFKLQHAGSVAGGVGSAVYCAPHALLYVATLPRGKDPSSALGAGLTAWRAVSDEPGYKLSAVSDALEDDKYQFYLPFIGDKNMPFIVNMALSPNNNTLICLHCTGEVSAWRLPLLKLIHRWPLASQPQHDLGNPLVGEIVDKKDKTIYYPADVSWWDDEAIILSRFSGAVSICTLEDLQNILGSRPEFLQGSPRVSAAHDGAFVALECESAVLPNRRKEESTDLVEQEYTDDTVYDLSKEMVKSLLYAITDMETFQPKPRRVTVVSRVYRLLGIKSTTPDELFSRKIESGKYSEALALADEFSLDRDLVYQHQWRKAPVSAESIEKYLSKISKKLWAVHQCVDRLPETLAAARRLLACGLALAEVEILTEINKDRSEPITDPDQIKLEDLNAYSSELLRCRHVMLFNRQRLTLYEAILKCEKSTYVKDEYDRLRSHSLGHSATALAQEGRLAALTCLWPHLPAPCCLAVLQQIPETINPSEYRHLLPSPREHTPEPANVEQEHDWCKKDEFRSIWSSNWSEGQSPSLAPATEEDISVWYQRRAVQIEEMSGLVSHSVALLIIAQELEVAGLEELEFQLRTLETLVYDRGAERATLRAVRASSPAELCRQLMAPSTKETFVSDLKYYVIPYLKRLEKRTGTAVGEQLVEYLKSLSEEDLTYALLTLQSAKELEIDVKTHLELASACLFAYNGTEQMDAAVDIFKTIPRNSDGSIPESDLTARVTSLDSLLRACSCVWRHGSVAALASLRDAAKDQRASENVVTGMARSLAVRDDKPSQQDWEKLLKDILDLQKTFFTCISVEKCHEIYALALLTSGDATSVRLAAEALTCSFDGRTRGSGDGRGRLVPYERSVQLVTAAAREYFNSASSLDDPALELARCCMTLIKDDNPQIQNELDLISALGLLNEFNLTILPIQVRLCEEKMSLIEDCLRFDPNAFMASHKLLKLAKLLRICADDDRKREGRILELICSGALAAGAAGGAAGAAAARRLHAIRQPAAALLATVADTAQAHADRNTRRDLYAAAATFCKGDAIEEILQSRLSLELEGLRGAAASSAAGTGLIERCPSTDDEYADAITTPVIEKKDLVPPEKKHPLLNYLVDSWQNKFGVTDKQEEATEKVPHCPEFYRGLYPALKRGPCYDYRGFSSPPALLAATALSGYYSDSTRGREAETEILQKCAEDLIFKDTPLALACMLRSVEDTERAAEGAGRGGELAACVLAAALVKCNATVLKDDVYLAPPAQLARSTLKQNNASPEQLALVRACLDRLERRGERERLRRLGYSVDGGLFTHDTHYRRETVLRLARSQIPEHIDFAYSLARKYNVEAVSVWAATAGAAVRGPPLRAVPGHLLPADRDRAGAAARLQEEVWPEIEGSEHNALLNYFTLLAQVDDKAAQFGLMPLDHARLLKKARSASPDLDYKLLLSQPTAPVFLEHLLAIIKPDNVGLLAKFLRNLPPPLRTPVAPSAMYTTWLTKYFFSISQSNATNKKWMQQYRQCASYFNKLSKDDILKLAEDTCFSDEAITRVPAGTRSLMLAQAADYCQLEHGAETKATPLSESWAAAGRELARWARFLDNFHSAPVRALADSHTSPDDDIWPEIEKSHGDLEKLRVPLGRLVLERDMRHASLLTLLQCLHIDTSVEKIYADLLDQVDSPTDVAALVSRATAAHRDGAPLDRPYLDRLMQRATEQGLPPHKLVGLLALSPRGPAGAEDNGELLQYSADLVRSAWPDWGDTWTEKSLQDESLRWTYFTQLLPVATSWDQKKALVDLLSFWPPTRSSSPPRSLHCELTRFLLEGEDQRESLALAKLLYGRGPVIPEEELQQLSSAVKGEAVLTYLWVVLMNKCERSASAAARLLREHKELIQNALIEDELIKQCLDNGLFTKLVSTPLYTPIINYILTTDSSNSYNVEWAISQLREKNFVAEAGHLQMMTTGVPTALRGFTQSVLMLKQYVFKPTLKK